MTVARYDAVADTYGLDEDATVTPTGVALIQLAGDVRGRRVLDLACGHGPMARAMAARGAEVTGIDLSGRLIARARDLEAADAHGIEYRVADAAAPTALIGQQFDVIVSHFGLSDIDDLDGVAATVRRLLQSGGRFVFAILHPCFPGVTDVSSSWRTSGSYFDEGWWRANAARSVLRQVVGANHRTLATYLNTLRRHGLWLDVVEEPAAEPQWSASRPGVATVPLYLVARCVVAG